jgi:deoxyribodipyrimidine photo-lyase
MQQPLTIIWLRRDLRLHDNAALYHALKNNPAVLPIFIFDKAILDKLEDKTDPRVNFLHNTVQNLSTQLQTLGSTIKVFHGNVINVYKQLLATYTINAVYTNTDYENYAQQRDAEIEQLLQTKNIPFHSFKDHVIFEKNEVTKDDGLPYTVFTPYSKKWLAKLNPYYYKSYPTEKYFKNFTQQTPEAIPALAQLGFSTSNIQIPPSNFSTPIISKYNLQRDFPAIAGTTKLGIHLRFGTISVRQLLAHALPLNNTYVNEIIWRDFYQQITINFNHIGTGKSFKPQYDAIEWLNNETHFTKWCQGQTGYPIVDAGMRELNTTGYMHNRVRMIVASFLTKHLLIDWRWGEAYFAKKLLDFDFAANNGGWQWAAGCGCDAAPYFRVFNPTLQTQKFDGKGQYIKKWVPEYDGLNYQQPIVEHTFARDRCLKHYKKFLN